MKQHVVPGLLVTPFAALLVLALAQLPPVAWLVLLGWLVMVGGLLLVMPHEPDTEPWLPESRRYVLPTYAQYVTEQLSAEVTEWETRQAALERQHPPEDR